MIRLICSKCGSPAFKIEWRVRPTRLPEDGRFKKEDFTGATSYFLLGECAHCRRKGEVKEGNFSWIRTAGKGWEELKDSETHDYKFWAED